MLEKLFRERYQKFLINPAINFCIRKKIQPLQITALGLIVGCLAFPLICFGYPITAILLLTLSGYLDTLDGSLARIQDTDSPIGAVCDILADRIVEALTILGLYAFAPTERALPCLCMMAATLLCVTSFLVVAIFSANNSLKSFFYSPGIIERAEAFILWSIMILYPKTFFSLSYSFTALVLITAFVRFTQFFKQQPKS